MVLSITRRTAELELRCHSAEAILAILMAIPDQRAVGLLTELSEDTNIRSILDRIRGGAFGLQSTNPTPQNASAETSGGAKLDGVETSERSDQRLPIKYCLL